MYLQPPLFCCRSHGGTLEFYSNSSFRQLPPVLTEQRQAELCETMQQGLAAQEALSNGDQSARLIELRIAGERAKEEFVRSNLKLVLTTARRYPTSTHVSIEDLISEGTLGLIRAVEKFDPSKGFKFSTYAMNWIQSFMGKSLDKASAVYIPPDRSNLARRALGRGDDINNMSEVDQQAIAALKIKSLDQSAVGHFDGGFEGYNYALSVTDEYPSEMSHPVIEAVLFDAFAILPSYLAEAVKIRFGLHDEGHKQTFDVVARRQGVCNETARKRVSKGLNEMRTVTKQHPQLAGIEI